MYIGCTFYWNIVCNRSRNGSHISAWEGTNPTTKQCISRRQRMLVCRKRLQFSVQPIVTKMYERLPTGEGSAGSDNGRERPKRSWHDHDFRRQNHYYTIKCSLYVLTERPESWLERRYPIQLVHDESEASQ